MAASEKPPSEKALIIFTCQPADPERLLDELLPDSVKSARLCIAIPDGAVCELPPSKWDYSVRSAVPGSIKREWRKMLADFGKFRREKFDAAILIPAPGEDPGTPFNDFMLMLTGAKTKCVAAPCGKTRRVAFPYPRIAAFPWYAAKSIMYRILTPLPEKIIVRGSAALLNYVAPRLRR